MSTYTIASRAALAVTHAPVPGYAQRTWTGVGAPMSEVPGIVGSTDLIVAVFGTRKRLDPHRPSPVG